MEHISNDYNTSNSSLTLTEEDHHLAIDLYKQQMDSATLPTVVLLGTFAAVETVGNTTILLVYWLLPKKSATVILILGMAVFDFLSSTVAIPGELFNCVWILFHILGRY